MSLFNQGWACRCDECGDQLLNALTPSSGAATRASVLHLAKQCGWIVRNNGGTTFCGKPCSDDFRKPKP